MEFVKFLRDELTPSIRSFHSSQCGKNHQLSCGISLRNTSDHYYASYWLRKNYRLLLLLRHPLALLIYFMASRENYPNYASSNYSKLGIYRD